MRRYFKSYDVWIVAGLLTVAVIAKGPALAAQVRSFLPFAAETATAAAPEGTTAAASEPGSDAAPADAGPSAAAPAITNGPSQATGFGFQPQVVAPNGSAKHCQPAFHRYEY